MAELNELLIAVEKENVELKKCIADRNLDLLNRHTKLEKIKEILISNRTANGCKIHNANCDICNFKNECMGNKILETIESEE